jgi:MerR family transcriptional regulator, redox-sensitive transcriptional activator SoxR
MDDWPHLTIGEVARITGVPASTIRYYESIGLLPAPARESGQRRYDEDVVGRLAFIGVSQQAGFTLKEIAQLNSGVIDGSGMAKPIRSASVRKLPEIEALIERAESMKSWLTAASECTCSTPDECTLFPEASDEVFDPRASLRVVQVEGKSCRRRT